MEITYKGEWFIHQFSHVKLPGILKIEDSKLKLTLFSSVDFRGLEFLDNHDSIDEYRFIVGNCEFDNKVTLVDCPVVNSNIISGQLNTFSVTPRIAFAGVLSRHFLNIDDIGFTKIRCQIPFLPSFIDDFNFYFKDPSHETYSEMCKRINREIKIEMENNFTISILRYVWHNEGKHNKSSFEVVHSVDFVSNHEVSFKELEKRSHEFKALLEVAVNKSSSVNLSYGISNLGGLVKIFHGKKKLFDKDTSCSYDVFFNYERLGELNFKKLIRKWFENLSSYSLIYEIHLETNKWFQGTGARLTGVMFNNRVLNVVQALESFHTIEHKGEDESNEKFNKRKKEVLDELRKTEDKKWLKSRARRKTKTLEMRLQDLFDSFDEVVGSMFLDQKSRNIFIGELSDLRNILSHGVQFDNKLDDKFFSYYHTSRILLTCCVLYKLGIEKNVIKNTIERSNEIRRDYRYYIDHKI